ncbi:F390 synthetase-related protein [Xanthocytophaga agilis]|uniref:Adenylate synthase n=1 Tax=Xanthocytophaga agilis TaxID=3048010 RepID=A0AAE3R9P7_9BACT|nr:F390 synthetase-related protein [Xanthocytophaga agilis]MDJ1504070.1 adenylate synthase [Xanthocytophaga agilis]
MKLKIVYYWLYFRFKRKSKTRKELTQYQQRKLQSFFAKVLTQSPYYATFVKEGKVLDDFPIINKQIFMEMFDQINTQGIKKQQAMEIALQAEESRNFSPEYGKLTVGLSTGTSGKRGLFVVSEKERAQWVGLVMNRVIKPIFFKKQKIAFFLRANSNLYSSIRSSLFEFAYFDIFKPVDELLADLNAYQPHILAAQPSVLSDIADRQQRGLLHISPKQIISFAEVLQDEDNHFISSVFNVSITQVYQCTEGFLGVSCTHGTIHLNEDFLLIEKKTIEGRRFHPVITDFTRSTQPIIRYELDDILIERESPCPCGSVFLGLERIEGRADDVLVFTTSEGKVKLYPDIICRMIARRTNDFRTYRIVQTDESHVRIELDCDPGDFDTVGQRIQAGIEDLLQTNHVYSITIELQKGITTSPGSKLRKVTRAIL